jgi:hypothetical protein
MVPPGHHLDGRQSFAADGSSRIRILVRDKQWERRTTQDPIGRAAR